VHLLGAIRGVEVLKTGEPVKAQARPLENVFDFRDGKVVRLCLYSSRHRAFADLGLAPEGGSSDS
jgi:hypothetical protein